MTGGVMPEEVLFQQESATVNSGQESYGIGGDLVLTICGQTAMLYRASIYVRTVDLADKIARRMFIVEIIAEGAMKSRVAQALKISRQTIDNYLAIKEYFGTEGLARGYSVAEVSAQKITEKRDFL